MRATRAPPWSRSRRKVIGAIGSTANGSVHTAGGGVYTVLLDDGRTVDASIRGRLKQGSGRVVIGDRVTLAEAPDSCTIEAVEERATELVRRGRGGRIPKVLAANLDRVFVVVSLRDPPANTDLIDRLLVLVESSGMRPILVLNKTDLAGASEAARDLTGLYEPIGYRVLSSSAKSGEGLEKLREQLCRGVSALIGPSGVGKSTLLNALDPALGLRTGELSRKSGTGRHTTVSSRLIGLSCGGFVADTPGFSDVALWGVAPDAIGPCFPEFSEYSGSCRFRMCTHAHEPDCGVRSALADGLIPQTRYDSYLKLRAEAVEAGER